MRLRIENKQDKNKLKDKLLLNSITVLDVGKASEFDLDFKDFKQVRELSLMSKKTYQIPKNLSELKQLTKLSVLGNCNLPNNIYELENLEELYISDEALLTVPNDIKEIKNLKKLRITFYDNIEFQPTPDWIYDIKSLQELDLTLCKFTKISDKINNLTNLETLEMDCSFTLLSSFPNLSKLKKLRKISLSGESVIGQRMPSYSLFPLVLESIKELSQIEELNLSGWRPKKKSEWLVVRGKEYSIPDIFDRHPNLTHLNLRDMNLSFVPNTILQLKKLKELNLTWNKNISNEEMHRIIKHLPKCKIESDIMYYKPKKKTAGNTGV